MDPKPKKEKPYKIGQVIPSQIFTNLASDQIIITEDKVRLEVKDFIEQYIARDTIIALISLFLSLLTTCLSSTFSDIWNIKGDQIKTTFVIFTVVSGLYMGLILYRKIFKSKTFDQFIQCLKGEKDT